MKLALETIRVLCRFKNAILEGPPGTGKSHVIAGVADLWQRQTGRPLAGNGRGRYAITLHPNTTYEEFVEGLRYDDSKRSFVRRDGFLREVIKDAVADPDSDYLVLIDEINRANVPKVFGDLLLTMEASKRATWIETAWGGGMEVTLPYSGEQFSLPSNIYLLGTMNTSDRSIAPLDSALRRRFGFIYVHPLVGDTLREQIVAVDGEEAAKRVDRSIDQLANLNEALRRCLGPNAMLGHSYLFGVGATEGSLADPNAPLAAVHSAVSCAHDVKDVFWLEASKLDGGSRNQLNLPDESKSRDRRGIVDAFYPMSSGGTLITERSPRGEYDKVEIYFEGQAFLGNVVRYNQHGPNYKLYYQGMTADGQKFSQLAADDRLSQKVHVWLRLPDNTLELMLLDRTDAMVAALRSVSVAPGGWHERTTGEGARSYGVVDLTMLSNLGNNAPDANQDAEWMIWRYAILPQLIDTVTQVGATELLAKKTRNAWLEAASVSDVVDRWTKFDDFLSGLGIAIQEEGYGMTRSLTVMDIPIDAAAEHEASGEPDDGGRDGEQ